MYIYFIQNWYIQLIKTDSIDIYNDMKDYKINKLRSTTVFIIDDNKKGSWVPNHIRMISEGSCDTEN